MKLIRWFKCLILNRHEYRYMRVQGHLANVEGGDELPIIVKDCRECIHCPHSKQIRRFWVKPGDNMPAFKTEKGETANCAVKEGG